MLGHTFAPGPHDLPASLGERPVRSPVRFTVGDGFKFGCGFVLALGISLLIALVLLALVLLLAVAMGTPFDQLLPRSR